MGRRFHIVAAATLLVTGSACDGGQKQDQDETPPALSQPIVDLAHVVEFVPFGATLSGSGVLNPAYELRTDVQGLAVVAAAPGVVVAIRLNGQGDDEIEIRPTASSVFAVIYDHVVERTVSVGTTVSAGTPLGRIGAWDSIQGRTELQVNRDFPDGNPRQLAYCPVQFGTPEFNAAHDASMAATGSTSSVCLTDTVVP